MADIYNYSNDDGIISTDTSEILSSVQAEWQTIFGADLSLEESTPQGRIMELLTVSRKSLLNNMAIMANQINPDYATGTYLDSIGGLFGVDREGATSTIVYFVSMSGVAGTYVPSGSRVQDENGNIFVLSGDVNIGSVATANILFTANPSANQTVTIGDSTYTFVSSVTAENQVLIGDTSLDTLSSLSEAINGYETETITQEANSSAYANYVDDNNIKLTSLITTEDGDNIVLSATSSALTLTAFSGYTAGNATGTFVASETGEITCLPNTLNVILDGVSGWESVNNNGAGNLGYDEESDTEYRLRIQNSLTKHSTSMMNSLIGALYDIEGLTGYSYYENNTNVTQTHSVVPTDVNYAIPVGEEVNDHSIFLFIMGGNSTSDFYQKVADVMLAKRSGGCGMQASIVYPDNVKSIIVQDNNYPYTMVFNTPEPKEFYISLTVRNSSYTGSDISTAIKDVISNWLAGNLNSVSEFNIGTDITPFDLSYVVQSQIGVIVLKCAIGLSADTVSTDTVIEIPINQVATCSQSNMSIVEG